MRKLLVVSSLGDLIDAMGLIRAQLFKKRYQITLVQCVCVILFTATTLFSGLVARASSRRTPLLIEQSIPGQLAVHGRFQQDLRFGLTQWDNITASLDAAGFPHDQLLDFLPDGNAPWMYNADEWNNTCSLSCTSHEAVPLSLNASGPASCTLAHIWTNEGDYRCRFPQLDTVLPTKHYNDSMSADYFLDYANSFSGLADSGDPRNIPYAVLLLYGYQYLNARNFTSISAWEGINTTSRIKFANTVCVLQDVPVVEQQACQAEKILSNSITSASCTTIDCEVRLGLHATDNIYSAWPNSNAVAKGYVLNLQISFLPKVSQQIALGNLKAPPAEDLIRFYQVFNIFKDSEHGPKVERGLTNKLDTTQVSLLYIIVVGTMIILVTIGLIDYLLFTQWGRGKLLPQGKLDWLLEAIAAANDYRHLDSTHRCESFDEPHDDGLRRGPPFHRSTAEGDSPILSSSPARQVDFEESVTSSGDHTNDVEHVPSACVDTRFATSETYVADGRSVTTATIPQFNSAIGDSAKKATAVMTVHSIPELSYRVLEADNRMVRDAFARARFQITNGQIVMDDKSIMLPPE